MDRTIQLLHYDHLENGLWSFIKPGLHIVVTIAKHACDDTLKRILKLSTHRLQVFLVNNRYLWS